MKQYFIEKTSKIEQTFEDEFKAEFNSPECMWDNFLEIELFDLIEFIGNNYTRFGDDWIRKSDNRIIGSGQIMEDFRRTEQKF
jgi:hypothetical protein